MAAIVGESGLPAADRRALTFSDALERDLIAQPAGRRAIGETFDIGWRLLETLPRGDLLRITDTTWKTRDVRAAADVSPLATGPA